MGSVSESALRVNLLQLVLVVTLIATARKMNPVFQVLLLVVSISTLVTANPWRDDLRCGPKFENAECNPFNENGYTCCSPHGWCGKTKDHCKCSSCIDYSVPWREDLRCGGNFKVEIGKYSGDVAECDPEHPKGYSCCSPHNWCGKTSAHCKCSTCVDYSNRR